MKERMYHSVKENVHLERGFTLVEVLCALLILGILLSVTLSLLTEQWRLTKKLRDQNEAHYAVMVAGRTIQDAIRSAKSVTWKEYPPYNRLVIENDEGSFQYEVSDLDRDGIKDLYRIRNSGYNPVVSGIDSWNCKKDRDGLWNITIKAKVGNENLQWDGIMGQRIQN